MSLYWSTTKATAVYAGSTAASSVYLGDTPIWRTTVAPTTTQFTTAGTTTYTIPDWCDYLDVILVGGGQGGGPGTGGVTGSGGYAGQWFGETLTRGVSISWSETSISVTVGAGGARGAAGTWPNPGATGESSIATIAGVFTHTATSTSGTSGAVTGLSPGNYTFNSVSYTGGSAVGQGTAGSAPGGGGGGGAIFNGQGGAGARGQVWIRAYQRNY